MTLLSALAFATALTAHADAPAYSVWSEFMPFEEVEQTLPVLCQARSGLLLAVHDGDWEKPSFKSLWQKAGECGISPRVWLLLKPEDGYWVNAENIPALEDTLGRFLEFMDARALSLSWLTLDLEPPPELQRELTRRLSRLDLLGALKLLRRGAATGALSAARSRLSALLERLHERGVRVHAVTMPFVIDDLEAGDNRIQAALGVPFAGVNWDEVSFMVYRPEYQRVLGRTGPRIVYDYAIRARRIFGERAAIDLGEVGTIGYPDPVPGYVNPRDLRDDVSAALAGGISQLHVYSLDGLLEQGGLEKWLQAPEARKPRSDMMVALLQRVLRWGRGLLPAGS